MEKERFQENFRAVAGKKDKFTYYSSIYKIPIVFPAVVID